MKIELDITFDQAVELEALLYGERDGEFAATVAVIHEQVERALDEEERHGQSDSIAVGRKSGGR